MPSCDFGRPCDCAECSRFRDKKCLKCNETVFTEWKMDRKGLSGYVTYDLCKKHHEEKH